MHESEVLAGRGGLGVERVGALDRYLDAMEMGLPKRLCCIFLSEVLAT